MVDQQPEAIVMMKGKRTKRPRPLSPLVLATTEGEGGPSGGENYSDESTDWTGPTTECTEEEDMAHCLILLAQGSKSNNSARQMIPTKPISNNNGSSSYECKTCNKSFASFQALGGHRASHKKPKLGIGLADHQAQKSSVYSLLSDPNQAHQHLYDHQFNEDEIALSLHISNNSNSSSNNNNNNKAKVHECGICGAEFSSGQALGGHMRRHRPIGGTSTMSLTIPTTTPSVDMLNINPNNFNRRDNREIKTHNFLSLDLNLPAVEVEEDDQQQQEHEGDNSKFVFPLNGKTLVFTTSLVDCHY